MVVGFQWASRIASEFNNQVNKERDIGLPFLGFMETKFDSISRQ